jgi:NAD(P)H-nitrite reductase large subunit
MEFEAKYVIIGGGIAGTAAAETLRKNDPNARIIIVSDEPHRLYSRVLLTKPNFFMEKIPFERIFLKENKWYEDLNIELWRGRTAVKVDGKEHKVYLDNDEVLTYEKLLLAVGGTPRKLDVPGADKKGVHYLRTVDETKRIIEAVKHAKKGVAIGGGIIGFEMTEMMHLAGMNPTFVIMREHYRQLVLGEEMATKVEAVMEKEGIKMMQQAETVEVLGGEHVTGLRFKDGTEIEADFVVIGIGTVLPHEEMLKNAGIEVDRGGIVANAKLQTTVEDVYTAGDCALYDDLLIKDKLRLGNWANAQAQGQTAARNMSGGDEEYRYVSFFTTHGFGLAMTYVGDFRQDINDRIVIERGSPKDEVYGRIVVEGNRIVGALFVNSSRAVSAIAKLIENGVDISARKALLADPNVNIASIV